MWGYRNFATKDQSKNNLLIGLISNGEGYHNNHHAQPRSASHGMRWWEFDVSYLTIRCFETVGLVWDVVRPRPIVEQRIDDQLQEPDGVKAIADPLNEVIGVMPPSSSRSAVDVSNDDAAKNIAPGAGV
jgi:hypothetical protein